MDFTVYWNSVAQVVYRGSRAVIPTQEGEQMNRKCTSKLGGIMSRQAVMVDILIDRTN